MTAIAVFWEGLPKWVRDLVIGLGLAVAIFFAGKAVVDEWKAEAVRRDREKQRARATQEAMKRVEAYNDARDTVLALPADELRERTEDDPNNRGLVSRD